ncbi:MAG: HEAT repeat domain-containing protein [Candidatus Riflebacteria bacterium]|nr:HEAT repeat domain-containing protein [Candidatus Riflebacteria bacterium]
MNQHQEIESFRFVKAARRLLRPSTSRLEEMVGEDFSDELKFEALLSLGRIGDNESLQTLTRAFNDFPDFIEPVTALGLFKSSTPVARLIERLQDPDALYKEEIVRVLGEIGDPMATRPLMELLHDEDRMVRYYSARALHKMGGRDVVQSLCGLLNDPDEWIVINVLEILSRMRDPEAIPALVGQFEIARDSRLKAIIISSLATFAEGRLLKTFESGLNSFDPRIQANSVEAVSLLKIPALEMKRKLKKFYGHANNRVRANLCIALANADSEAVTAELSQMLQSRDAPTRRSAAYVLARINNPRREEYIHQLLADENFGVRKMALKAALELGDMVGAREIQPLLVDENQWVRREAVECATRIDDFPDDSILGLFKKEESPPVIEYLLRYIVSRRLTAAVPNIIERIRKEPEEELPWLISALGHLGAREELGKVKKSLGAVRSNVYSEYYKALMLNGELAVFEEIAAGLNDKKREQELLVWVKIAGVIGEFLQKTDEFSRVLLDALAREVKHDMEGVATFDGVETADADAAVNQLQEGIRLFDARDYSRAREIFERILKASPGDNEVRFYLASTVYNLGDMSSAQEMLEKAMSAAIVHVESGILLGQIYFRRKEWAKLAACYEKLKKHLSNDDKKNVIRVYGALGLAYFNQKKYAEAIEALNLGLQANPRDLSSSYHLALCYYSIGETEKARRILETLRKTLPADSQVLKNVIDLLQRI